MNHSLSLLRDLIDECTDSFTDSSDTNMSRIVSLYVVSRAADGMFDDVSEHLLRRIRKMAA